MLRCFNDCFAVLGLFSAIYAYQRNQWHLGTFLYTTGLNVKMSLLLPLPAIGVLTLLALGGREAITQAMIILQVSVILYLEPLDFNVANVHRLAMGTHSAGKPLRTSQELLSSRGSSSTSGP